MAPTYRRRRKARMPLPPERLLRAKLLAFRILVAGLFLVLVGQVTLMQIIKGSDYQSAAINNRVRILDLLPTRGIIYDSLGRPLARNEPVFVVGVTPEDMPSKPAAYDVVLDQLTSMLNPLEPTLDRKAIEEIIADGKKYLGGFEFVPILSEIPRDLAMTLKVHAQELPGVEVHESSRRVYMDPETTALSQILGYMGPITKEDLAENPDYPQNARLGKAGLERSYESFLRGQAGRRQVEVDVTGNVLRELAVEPQRNGYSLRLSIESKLQQKVAQFLQEGLDQSPRGVAILMDPRNGQILTMVSLPTYNSNLFSQKKPDPQALQRLKTLEKEGPLVNHAIQSQFPPASTFKLINASAALQENVVTPETKIQSAGSLTLRNDVGGTHTFKDHPGCQPDPRTGPTLTLDLMTAIARSCNVFFWLTAAAQGNEPGANKMKGLDWQRLDRYASEFGIGKPTGIDLPGEVKGILPDNTYKVETFGSGWATGDTYNLAIGQGFLLTTPLQMLTAVSAIANGGDVYQPQVVRDVLDDNRQVVRPYQPKVVHHLSVSSANLDLIRQGMRAAVERPEPEGSATKANLPSVKVAGKTGTSEIGARDPLLGDKAPESNGWFVGFAPYDNPKVAVVVFLDQGGAGGGANAAPIARKILEYYFSDEYKREKNSTGR